jgi:hypothetical protein
MKITKQQLKQIIQEEFNEAERAANDPEKILGDIYARLDPLLKRWRAMRPKVEDPELQELLHDTMDELGMYQVVTHKYKDLGEIR